MVRAQGIERSVTNVWALEVNATCFAYVLRRSEGPNVRDFRVGFDVTKPVAAPPPAWGS